MSIDEPARGARALAAASANTDTPQRSGTRGRKHHYLKCTLTTEDLQNHFGTIEPKEIAAEITRMGQRDLQKKFRDFYAAPTFSNNNNWLRRKLMEAARCMHFYKPHEIAHVSGRQDPTKCAASHPKPMRAVGCVRGAPPVLRTPALSSSTAAATKSGIQAPAGELYKMPWKPQPNSLNESVMAAASHGSDSSDTSRCEERPREFTQVSSTPAAQWAYDLGFVRTRADGLPAYEASELLAKDEHSPMGGDSANLASPHLQNSNCGSGTEMSLDVSPYTHLGTNHGDHKELFLSDAHSPPMHAALAALGVVSVQEHTRPKFQYSDAQTFAESNMVIGGRHSEDSEPGPDLHTPQVVRTPGSSTAGSSSATFGVNAAPDMGLLPRTNTAAQGDTPPWGSAVLHLQLTADHHEAPFLGMSSERLALAPVAPFVPSMAAQTRSSQVESCCGLDTDHEDADLLDADLLVQALQFLRPDEALQLIEQNISAIDAQQQLLDMYRLA